MQQQSFKELSALRYSCRNYSAEPVSEADLDYIMQCARLAPSAVNLQPWHFYVITNAEARNNIIRCYKRDWIAQAPVYILCTVRHDQEWIRRADQKRHGDIDIAIAAEHICLAATERGLGSCWVCNFDAAMCHELFGFSAEEEPVVIIPIGHIDQTAEVKRTDRKQLEEILTRI